MEKQLKKEIELEKENRSGFTCSLSDQGSA